MSKKKKLTIAAGSALCALSACLALAACGGNSHNVKEIQAKDATCTEAGNEHYYMCTDDGCGKVFSDAEGKNEIKLEDVVKPALGHDPKKVEAEETTCTKDGHIEYYDCSRCDVNFADAAGTQALSNDEIFVAKYDHDLIEEVKAKAPTLEADGNVYHWHCDRCDVDFTNRNADKEIEDIVIPKLVKETGLTINVKTYDAPETEGTAPAGTFTLKGTEYPDSDTADVSIADGKLSATELIPDSYKFEIEGYYPVYFKVEKGVKTYNLDLYKYFHKHTVDNENGKLTYDYIDGNLKIHINNVGWDDSRPIVHFADGKLSGENYMSKFTLRYENYHTAEPWYSRCAIRLGKSGNDKAFVGVMIYPRESDVLINDHIVSDMGFGEGNDTGRNPVTLTGSQATAFNNAIKGDGLQVRAMRSGKLLSVLVNLDGEWVQIWSRNVEGLETEFAITATSPNNSTFTVSDMKYFSYEPISKTHFGYFYEGEGDDKTLYSSFDGKQTTLAAQEIKKLNVTVNVEVYNGVREKIDIPAGLKLTLTDEYDRDTITDATIADGVLSATQFLPGKYNITAIDGYYAIGSLYISADTAEYTLKLYQIDSRFEISNNDNRVTVSEAEGDLQIGISHVGHDASDMPYVTLTNEYVASDNYMTEFTVRYAFDEGKDWGWTQRFGIQLGTTTENGKVMGISFFAINDGGGQLRVCLWKYGDNGFGENDMKQPFAEGSAEVKAVIAALKGNGVTFRAVRQGNKLYLRAKVGNDWVLLYEAEASDLGAGIAFAASSNDSVCTVSGISYADGFVAESQDRYAYFTKGEQYITESGEDTTLAGLAVVKIDMTINVEVYDGLRNKIDAPDGLTFGLKDSIGREEKLTATVTADGKLSISAFYPDTYEIDDIDGYYAIGSIVFNRVNKEYTLKVYQLDNRFVVDGNDQRVVPSEVEGDLQLSFNNVGFDGNISIVEMTDAKITGTHYMTEFTVAYDTASWNWTERFAIRLGKSSDGEKFLGLMMYVAGDQITCNEVVASNRNLGDGSDFGRTPFKIAGENATAISNALKGDGLQMRALRMGDRLIVSVKIGETWTKIWEKTVAGLDAGIAFMASSPNCKAVISNIQYGTFVADTDEVYAHFTVGNTFVTMEGDTATQDDLKVVKSEGITVNVEVYDGLLQKITAPADLKLSLKDAYNRDTVTDATVADGKLSVTAFYPCQYTFNDIDGYYTIGTITFDKLTKEYTVKLYQIDERFERDINDSRVTASEVEGDLQIGFDVNFNDYRPVSVTLTNNNVTGTNYLAELTLQVKNPSEWNWQQRIQIDLGLTDASGTTVGFIIMPVGASEVKFARAEYGNTGLNPFNDITLNGTDATAFVTALTGNGVMLRAIRNGDTCYLSAYLGDKWVPLHQVKISGLDAGIKIYATTSRTDGVVFSHISYADGFVAETNEKYAHFTKGNAYITVNGEDTTPEGLDIKKIENLTVNVVVYDKEGDGKQEVTAPTGTFNLYNEVTRFTEENVTISEGKLSATALYPGKYVIMIDGYKPVTFTVTEDTTEYNLSLYVHDRANNVTIDEETGDITYNNPWGSGIVTTLKDDISGENYMTEFTLKYQFTDGKNWDYTERFSIILGMSPVDEKPIGFMFFMPNNNEIKGANTIINDIGGFGEGHEGYNPFANSSADTTAINTALKGDGLQVRGVRNGNKLTVYFLIGTEWKQAWTKTVEGLSSYLGVTAAHNNSTLTVTGITFGDYVAATSTVAAHLVVGEGADAKVYTLDGVETTLEDLAITE